MSALSKIKKIFPHVTTVIDSKKTISITVLKTDNKTGRKKDFTDCALARACKRTKIADSVIIGLTTSYLIKNNIATRYLTSVSVGREITSFDRHQDFAPGVDYKLGKIPASIKLGMSSKSRGKETGKNGPQLKRVHKTVDVRELRKL